MKTCTCKLQSFSTRCAIILVLILKLQQEYVDALTRECDDDKFGYECRFTCKCQQNNICNVNDGTCPSGCADGFWGSNCQLSNDCYYNGHSGNYEGTKSVTSKSKTCKKWNHAPHNYCRPFYPRTTPWCYDNRWNWGWNYCSVDNCHCPPGLYGKDCTKECHCKNASEVCGVYTGHCLSSCGPGWKGIYCNETCDVGTFGNGCDQTCHCANNSKCQKSNGKCLDDACSPGYIGYYCQTTCPAGKFGDKCEEVCWCKNPSHCNKTDGRCTDGKCKVGYKGQNCQQLCPAGKFGDKCEEVCWCKNPSHCNQTDGRCTDGKCKVGYKGQSCQQPCSAGKFGEECEEVCHCKNPIHCNHTDGRCTDGECKFGYKGQTCQQRNIAVIVVILLVLILILIGIIVGVAICLKKRKPKKTSDGDELKSVDNVSMSHIEELNLAYDENDKEDMYQNTALLAKENILLYIEKNKMEEVPFASEFSRFPQGLIYSHEIGISEQNIKKNRYKTLVPYDYTRVVLLPDEISSSDYINASYITEEKRYIATQGPITGTFNDFWRMIWQEKCNTIIMLTDIIENGKLKCAQYWPDLNRTETYGKFKIHCVQEKRFMIYTYRLLSITKSTNLSQEEYFVDHFQCTTWPDHDVPEDPIYFIEFRNKVRHMKSTKPPYVVHCSAGVGRTGTYIALDILLEKLWKNSWLDVFQCVNDLRQQRPLMVHRRRQYQFIYEVLAEDVLTGFSEMTTECFPAEFRRMLCKETDASSPLREQYERLLLRLNQSSLNLKDSTKESLYENICKTNDGDIGFDDIFNTIYLDGFTMMNEIIVTIQPSEKLTEEFWKLIYQKKCHAIIMFEDLFNGVAVYWPDDKLCPQDYGSMKVELMCLTETDNFFQRQFKVSSTENSSGDVWINHFQSKIWLGNQLPSQIEIIEFIQTVSGYIKPQKEILVHCQDGYSKCGLFSILYVMIHMLKTDHYISILRLVRRMRKKNANIADDFRSYEYCWMVANLFLGELSVYSNF